MAVELDRKLLPVLNETLSEYDNVEIIHADALKLDFKKLIQDRSGFEKVVICANLPYYITSPLVMKFLEDGIPTESVTVMIQKEAAVRMCSLPGTRESGAVTLSVWYNSQPEILFNVSRGSFMPPPNVDSAVVKFTLRKEPPVDVKDEKLMFSLIKAAFAQRRKTLLNSLNSSGYDKNMMSDILLKLDISLKIRAENIELKTWADISNNLILQK